MKMTVDQALRKAKFLALNGDREEAEKVYRAFLERFPGNARVLAELQSLSAVTLNPPQEELGALVSLYRQGQWSEALTQAADLIEQYPRGEILRNIAGALNAASGRLDEAIAHYDSAIALASDYVEAYNNRGNALKDRQRPIEALASFDQAIRYKPDYAEAHMNRGIVLAILKRFDEALASYDLAIRFNPGLAQAYNNRSNTLLVLLRFDEALADLDTAIRLMPDYADAYVNRGNVLKAVKRLEEAVESYDKAIALAPGRPEAHSNRGVVLKFLKRPEEALTSFEKALALKPDYAVALSETLYVQAHLCRWTDQDHATKLSQLAVSGAAVPPFHMLVADDDPAHQLAYAKSWAAEKYAHSQPVAFEPRASDGKIRIGYFSADFYNHATLCLMAGMLEHHDKSRFEIHAFSYGADVQDKARERLVEAVDAFHDVSALSDQAIAALARTKSIDIAIDLKGYTETSRSDIFAYRPAPSQVNYLGYPGTMGADFIDYIIADSVIIPEDSAQYYSEKVMRLPHSYQVNDRQRAISEKTFSRSDLGLPENGFVFCSFNNNYKITSAEFDIWMRLLGKVEGSVLWLLEDNKWAAANLRREAEVRGVNPNRLIFAERMPVADHLARQRCADLFLDTFKVNAHTTASDALWTGLPIVTKLGRTFVGRVAGSLLHAIGLPELVTETDEAYEQLALELATDPARLAAVKAKLVANRLTTPLFDTAQYTRDIEHIFEQIHEERTAITTR